jgi:hypothetical protein
VEVAAAEAVGLVPGQLYVVLRRGRVDRAKLYDEEEARRGGGLGEDE